MKKGFLLIAGVVISITLTQCTSKKAATAGMSAESKTIQDEVKRNYTQAQIDEGKTIWSGACGKCHKLYAPESHSINKWENVLPRMSKRAKLNDEQAGKVRAYLIDNANY